MVQLPKGRALSVGGCLFVILAAIALFILMYIVPATRTP
jgi:hypothetical protein